ncbi:uncharacterized protein LOC118907566 [Manis pentadactyla]|uniref:uncharacterized protein LOC118907566 n=1 Tax=Manis pentadactyla TaxID=143292 RepID=UPI00255C6302|nr:uncharacterized protein LOC118907566 [Manis pentadactyla]
MGAVEGQRSLQLHSLVVHLKATTSWAQTKEKRAKHPGFLTLRTGKSLQSPCQRLPRGGIRVHVPFPPQRSRTILGARVEKVYGIVLDLQGGSKFRSELVLGGAVVSLASRRLIGLSLCLPNAWSFSRSPSCSHSRPPGAASSSPALSAARRPGSDKRTGRPAGGQLQSGRDAQRSPRRNAHGAPASQPQTWPPPQVRSRAGCRAPGKGCFCPCTPTEASMGLRHPAPRSVRCRELSRTQILFAHFSIPKTSLTFLRQGPYAGRPVSPSKGYPLSISLPSEQFRTRAIKQQSSEAQTLMGRRIIWRCRNGHACRFQRSVVACAGTS